MQKVVISGADGFVGSHTVNCFLENGVEVLALDINEHPKRLQPHDGLVYRKCDVTDMDALRSTIAPNTYDAFIHLAWAGSAGAERTDYQLQMRNAASTVECLKAAHRLGIKRFICAGSIMEYEAEAAVHTQGSRPAMGYIYGIGKLTAHCLCKPIAAENGMELIWPMVTNAYGAGEVSPRFINTTLRKIIEGKPLQFTSATQNYDFVYITDVARALFLIAKHGKPFCEYVIGSSNARPLREFIVELQQTLAPNAALQFGDIPYTGTNMPLCTFDTGAVEADCGFKPEVSFAQGIRQTMEWLKTFGGEGNNTAVS